MKSILPILAWLSLLTAPRSMDGQTPSPIRGGLTSATPQPAPAPMSGDALLHRALVRVDSHSAIAARLRHKVDLLGRTTFGTGVYLQQGRGVERMLRLELRLDSGGRTSAHEEVANRVTSWVYEDAGGAKSLAQIDLARLRRARPKTPPGQPLPAAQEPWIMLGGLPKLLANIEAAFRFAPAVEGRLDDLRVWTLEGRWKPERLAGLLPDQKGAIESGGAVDLSRLTPNVPDRVVVHLGYDDLFPYRIEYWRSTQSGKEGKSGSPGNKLLVLIELYEVQVGVAIDPRQFTLSPKGIEPVDRTSAFLERLGLEEVIAPSAKQPPPPRR
jgi:hypothetical protein